MKQRGAIGNHFWLLAFAPLLNWALVFGGLYVLSHRVAGEGLNPPTAPAILESEKYEVVTVLLGGSCFLENVRMTDQAAVVEALRKSESGQVLLCFDPLVSELERERWITAMPSNIKEVQLWTLELGK